MNHSETLGKLAPAFVAAQAEIENAHKNARNPHFKSTYADLAEIVETIRPTLAKHKLAVIQIPGYENGALTMDTMLLHESGEWIGGVSGSPIAKQDPQGVGSAITYLRRYSLAAVCGIAQEDDDGNAASRRDMQTQATKEWDLEPATTQAAIPPAAMASPKQIGFIKKLLQSHHVGFALRAQMEDRVDRGLTKDKASEAIEKLNALIAEGDAREKSNPIAAEIAEQERDFQGTLV